ncbi:flagellar biosynthetic protein FliO [Virgibacillus pantothenticus]|uniref:flagellar biosynthetic protein FliO n=1 Tax=Virgibacillus pantothenticus TaxID=1473 RepID=UPI00147B39BF|nr:flagellar biosynthetic protein FliO [Virgibacillus pantothenticus]
MRKLTVISSLLSLLLFLFVIEIEAEAAPKSVNDCINDEADCESSEQTPANTDKDTSTLLNEETETKPLWVSFVKVITVLFLILGLIYLVLLFLKRKNALFSQVKTLENLGGISVGQNKSLQIIRLGNKYYLIGVGDNVELLQEINDPSLIEDLQSAGGETPAVPKFIQKLTPGSKSNDQDTEKKADFKQQFMNELDKLKQNRSQLIQQYKQKEDRNE